MSQAGWIPDRLRRCQGAMRGAEAAEGAAGLSHPSHGRFDGGPPVAVATTDACRGDSGKRLGECRGEMVQSPARFWVPDPRAADLGHFRAYGDFAAVRLHRTPPWTDRAGALW